MGAYEFHDSHYGPTAQDAYDTCVEAAVIEFGEDSYNGTISTSGGFRMLQPFFKGESEESHWERVLNTAEKWERCCCWKDAKEDNLWHFGGWAAS